MAGLRSLRPPTIGAVAIDCKYSAGQLTGQIKGRRGAKTHAI